MIDVRETIKRLRDKRREQKIVPDAVPYVDLCNDIMLQLNAELNDMYKKEEISVNKTLNSKSINLK